MAQITYRKDYKPYPFEVEECRLSFQIFDAHVIVGSQIRFAKNPKYKPKHGPPQNCVLDGVGLEILKLELDGQALEPESDYRYQAGKLELLATAGKRAFDFAAQVKIDPYNNKALEGMYRSGKILCTQNEATGFRHITFYPDRPDVMSRFITEIEADRALYPRLLSNGNLQEQCELPDGRHYARWEDPFPKPCYLYALVAGDLDLLQDSFRTCSGRQVSLEIYTDKGKAEQARYAMESLQKAMLWDEQRFGREYDLDLFMIVAVDSFNYGAMENKGLNIFNSSLLLATDATATDATYQNIATTVAHEYFHNWTGNRITCRDWFQLTLKEGLTVYRDELFTEDHFGRGICRIQQVQNLRNRQYPEDRGPNRHPIRPDSFIDINNFYTQTVYQKGAAVIRMIAQYLGEKAFRKGMDRYFERYDGQAVTCDDFIDALQEEADGKDLSGFRNWYEQAGTPQLHARSEWDGRKFTLHLRQENPNAAPPSSEASGAARKNFPPLTFPLPLTLYEGKERLCESTILIDNWETKLNYIFPEERRWQPVPSLMLDHTSPVEVHYDYSEEQLRQLMAFDKDIFNRYEAVQRYLIDMLLDSDIILYEPFVEGMRIWLGQLDMLTPEDVTSGMAYRYLSQLLEPPSVQRLADTQKPPQFHALQQLRESYCRQLTEKLVKEMVFQYVSLTQPRYERSKEALGKRALRNTLLHYLCRLGGPYHELAYQQYQTCDNMTDSYAALQALAYWPGPRSEAAIQDFGDRWQGDFQVLCRWFALQAGAPLPETLQNIARLENHSLFQKDNPNMLGSLYEVLGHNLPVFHDPGPKGDWPAYAFLARRILKIDRFNSMVAAGLAKSFVAYKSLEAQNQAAMGQALDTILHSQGISDRLYEIVSKTLEQ